MIDLHVHLDGSIRSTTLEELFEGKLPNVKFYPNMGIQKALASFRTTLSVMQELDRITRITEELCFDLTKFGTSTAEIRFAPQLHCSGDIESVVDAAIDLDFVCFSSRFQLPRWMYYPFLTVTPTLLLIQFIFFMPAKLPQ